MNLNEAVLAGLIVVGVIAMLTSCGYQNSECRLAAIKAGMKAAEVRTACSSQ